MTWLYIILGIVYFAIGIIFTTAINTYDEEWGFAHFLAMLLWPLLLVSFAVVYAILGLVKIGEIIREKYTK